MRDEKKVMTMPGSKVKARSGAHESLKFDHFQTLSPPPFIMRADK